MVQIHSPRPLLLEPAIYSIRRSRRHSGCGLGIPFSNRLHATNLSRLNLVSYGEKCPHGESRFGKIKYKIALLEEKSNCKPKSGALHGQVAPVGSPRTLPRCAFTRTDIQGLTPSYSSSYARFSASISNLFILRNALVTRAVRFLSVPPSISFIIVGVICQERPYLSLSQPHCPPFGSAESLSQK